MKPADLPNPEKHAHGTRARYVGAKCRCADCRKANTAYYHELQKRAKAAAAEVTTGAVVGAPQVCTTPSGQKYVRVYKRACPGVNGTPCATSSHLRKDSKGRVCRGCRTKLVWNGLVPADEVREHLRKLSKKGVGYKSVAESAQVGETLLSEISTGKKNVIRAQAAKRVLEVEDTIVEDGALTNGRETRKAIREMLRLGLTKTEIAERLGYVGHAIQFRKKVRLWNAVKVQKLLLEVREEVKRSRELDKICIDCGYSHLKQDRLVVLKKLLPQTGGPRPLTEREVQELRHIRPLSCFYEKGGTGYMRLHRDLKTLGVAGRKKKTEESSHEHA
jgi:hypothetical protein